MDEFDEENDNIVSEHEESFHDGEQVEVTIMETDVLHFVDFQFGDGSMAFGINTDYFKIIEEK